MSTSAAQLAANRANAVRSTGPRTAEGRAVAARNGTKHGLATEHHDLQPHEDSEAFNELLEALRDDLQPNGIVEELLVRQVAEASWRVRRAAEYEVSVLVAEGSDESGVGLSVWRDAQAGKGNALPLAQRYLAAAERSRMAALHELERRQALRRGAEVPVPVAVEVNVCSEPASE